MFGSPSPYRNNALVPGIYMGSERLPKKPYGGLQEAMDFLYEDEGTAPKEAKQENTAPATADVKPDRRMQLHQQMQDEQNQLAMDQANYKPNDYFGFFGMTSPNEAAVQSSGKWGTEHIGQYGKQIINELSGDLGYAPNLNSIYRDPTQQAALVKQGVGVPNSWHLTGDAIDLKPDDWNHLSQSQQGQFRSNYDVIYHNNHYHIEPKGKRMAMGGKFRPKY